jgi:hypothetical protein
VISIGLFTALALLTILSFRATQRSVLDLDRVLHSLVVLYFSIIACFFYYILILLFICGRYISAPWVRRSYRSDQLAWYVRALYWERLPSLMKCIMFGKRMLQTLVARFFLDKPVPYGFQPEVAARGKRSGTFLGRFKRIFTRPSWQDEANGLSLEVNSYTDNYDGDDIPLLPSNEPNTAFHDGNATSSALLNSSLPETDAFDFIGEENARTLLTVSRALIMTSDDESGQGVREIMSDVVLTVVWIYRFGKRRKIRDILFDFGIIRRKR